MGRILASARVYARLAEGTNGCSIGSWMQKTSVPDRLERIVDCVEIMRDELREQDYIPGLVHEQLRSLLAGLPIDLLPDRINTAIDLTEKIPAGEEVGLDNRGVLITAFSTIQQTARDCQLLTQVKQARLLPIYFSEEARWKDQEHLKPQLEEMDVDHIDAILRLESMQSDYPFDRSQVEMAYKQMKGGVRMRGKNMSSYVFYEQKYREKELTDMKILRMGVHPLSEIDEIRGLVFDLLHMKFPQRQLEIGDVMQMIKNVFRGNFSMNSNEITGYIGVTACVDEMNLHVLSRAKECFSADRTHGVEQSFFHDGRESHAAIRLLLEPRKLRPTKPKRV